MYGKTEITIARFAHKAVGRVRVKWVGSKPTPLRGQSVSEAVLPQPKIECSLDQIGLMQGRESPALGG